MRSFYNDAAPMALRESPDARIDGIAGKEANGVILIGVGEMAIGDVVVITPLALDTGAQPA